MGPQRTKQARCDWAYLLENAEVDDRKGLVLVIESYRGTLVTSDGEYEIRIGEQKMVGRPILIHLVPIEAGKPVYSKRVKFILPQKDGREFYERFTDRMRARAHGVRPDAVKPRD